MLAIHGIWAHGALSLWAEDSGQSAPVPSRQGRSGRIPRPHPFAAAPGLLADVLAEFGEPASDLVRKATDDELTLWLPGKSAGPLASPDLARAVDLGGTADPATAADLAGPANLVGYADLAGPANLIGRADLAGSTDLAGPVDPPSGSAASGPAPAIAVGTGFSDKERAAPPPLGSTITFRYQELSEAGVPRFPSYVGVRVDK